MEKISIRNEREEDYGIVEEITREAFYNVYVPGCIEHYLVRRMREHEDFIPELDFVLELDGRIIGNIMYTKARLNADNDEKRTVLTFGPVSILPQYQQMGFGKMLIEHSLRKAEGLGYDAVVIFGCPRYYTGLGFRSCRKYCISSSDGRYPASMMVRELVPGILAGRKWTYHESPVMAINEEDALRYDDSLRKMERKYLPSQEEFYIMSHSYIEDETAAD